MPAFDTPEPITLSLELGVGDINIVASDRPGLLYRVARRLSEHHLNLYSAKINTLGDRAEDVFLVSGPALSDSKDVLKLEQELLTELQI